MVVAAAAAKEVEVEVEEEVEAEAEAGAGAEHGAEVLTKRPQRPWCASGSTPQHILRLSAIRSCLARLC